MRWNAAHVLGALVGAATLGVSYVVQRLASAWFGEVNPKLILATEHIPFFWRLTLAGVHALTAGAVVATLVDEARAERWLDRTAAMTVLLTLVGAVAMGLVP